MNCRQSPRHELPRENGTELPLPSRRHRHPLRSGAPSPHSNARAAYCACLPPSWRSLPPRNAHRYDPAGRPEPGLLARAPQFLKHTGRNSRGYRPDIAGHEAKAPALDAANRPWKHLAQRSATPSSSIRSAPMRPPPHQPALRQTGRPAPETIPSLVTEILQRLAHTLWYPQ